MSNCKSRRYIFSHNICNCIISKSFVISLQVHGQVALRIAWYTSSFSPGISPTGIYRLCIDTRDRLCFSEDASGTKAQTFPVVYICRFCSLSSTALLELLATYGNQFTYHCAVLISKAMLEGAIADVVGICPSDPRY